MRRSRKRLSLPAAILVAGCLAAGCGSTVKSAINSLPRGGESEGGEEGAGEERNRDGGGGDGGGRGERGGRAWVGRGRGEIGLRGSAWLIRVWFVCVLGCVVLAAWLVVDRGSPAAAAAAGGRSSREEGLGLMMREVGRRRAGGRGDAAAGSDIQRRADDLAQTLYALREEVPQDSADRARIADTLASLQAVRSAMDAERAPGGASLEQADVVRSRLASFESSLRALGALTGSFLGLCVKPCALGEYDGPLQAWGSSG